MNKDDKQAYIFASMFAIANRMQLLGDKLDINITIKQWLFLAVVSKSENKAPTISEIARQAGYSRQNVKKMALILEEKGLVEIKKDPSDARINRVSLTKKCLDYFTENEYKGVDFITRIFKDFDDTTLDGLYQGLQHLSETINVLEREYYEED